MFSLGKEAYSRRQANGGSNSGPIKLDAFDAMITTKNRNVTDDAQNLEWFNSHENAINLDTKNSHPWDISKIQDNLELESSITKGRENFAYTGAQKLSHKLFEKKR